MQRLANITLQKPSTGRPCERGWGVLATLAFLVLLLVLGVAIYAVYRQTGGRTTRIDAADIKQAASEVRDASENAMTTTKVKTAFALSKSISVFEINVESNNGVVTLNGEVPSDRTKRLAEAVARETVGVRDVRNNLRVNPNARANPEALRGESADPELRAKIEERLTASRIDPLRVTVAVQDKVVTLSGEVDSSDQKHTAERVAWGFEGVRDVRNNLRVANQGAQTGGESTDVLAKRVEFELYSSRAFDLAALQIQNHGGVITLNGPVRSLAEKELAQRIASDVDGVKSVRNNLTVAPAAEPTMPSHAE